MVYFSMVAKQKYTTQNTNKFCNTVLNILQTKINKQSNNNQNNLGLRTVKYSRVVYEKPIAETSSPSFIVNKTVIDIYIFVSYIKENKYFHLFPLLKNG